VTKSAVQFLRVLSIRSKNPSVMATVDDRLVRWNNRRGWDYGSTCAHISVVSSLIDPVVFTPISGRA
jgi:hypothetical protein